MNLSCYDQFVIKKYKNIESTQLLAKEYINNSEKKVILNDIFNNKKFLCINAESQSNGVGQYGRIWDSPVGNLYMSCIVRLEECSYINLTQTITILVHEILLSYGIKTKIKWVNDILYNNQKLGGVLCEISKFQGENILIIGIGINVNESKWENSISIKDILNKKTNVNDIMIKICNELLNNLNDFYNKGIEFFIKKLNDNSAYINENISITHNQNTIEGIFKGYNEKGMLIIQRKNKIHILFEGQMNYKSLNQKESKI